MANESSTIVQRLWNYCNVLRDDGMSYGDYVEQLTDLLFLKLDDENVRVLGKPSAIPAGYTWASLRKLSGDELESHYRQVLAALGQGSGLIPVIFRKAQNKIQDPAKRDKANLDIFWLRDEALEDADNLPDPDVLARAIVEELKAALVQFNGFVEELGEEES